MKQQISLFLLLILFFSSCSLNNKVERRNKKGYADAPYDAIIVPGYPYQAEQNKELFSIRLHWAKAIYDRGLAKNIIFSGAAVHTPYKEGMLMRIFAEEMGIPSEILYDENEALHTNENIKNCKRLAKELGFERIAFATDPYQFSYMTTLVSFLAPGTPLLTFTTDSMAYYNQDLPAVDISPAYVDNWTNPTKK